MASVYFGDFETRPPSPPQSANVSIDQDPLPPVSKSQHFREKSHYILNEKNRMSATVRVGSDPSPLPCQHWA